MLSQNYFAKPPAARRPHTRAPAAFANFCGRALYFPGVRSHFLLQLLAVISTQ
jgi:hypothetical protein